MAQTVLPKLQEISEALVAQEAALNAQLAEVQEKLKGVRAILPLFGEVSSNKKELEDEPEALVKTLVKTKVPVEKTAPAPAEKKAPAVEKKPKAESSKVIAIKAPATKALAKKKDGRTASWQKYTRPGVKEQSIPDAVRLVLETQPEKSFKIAEVMDALFTESMPKSQHLKARNRISNVLSGGVRSGDWFKGDRGTYRLAAD